MRYHSSVMKMLVVQSCCSVLLFAQTAVQNDRPQVYHKATRPEVPKWLMTPQPFAPDAVNSQLREKRNKSHTRLGATETVDDLPTNDHVLHVGGTADFLPHSPTPSELSDLIVTGVVVGGRSFLTTDRKNIYSEAFLRVNQVLKGTPVNSGLLTIQQDGGTVRLDNGRVVHKLPMGGSYPLDTNQPYLVFLRYQANTADYVVIGLWDISQPEAQLVQADGRKAQTSPTGVISTETLLASVADKVKEEQK